MLYTWQKRVQFGCCCMKSAMKISSQMSGLHECHGSLFPRLNLEHAASMLRL